MKPETKWVPVTACVNIPLREGRAVAVGGRNIAIFNLGERFLAIDDRCPHRGGPLSEGLLSGKTVVCPLHATRVDLECGAVANAGRSVGCVATFGTRVVAGTVELELLVESPEQEVIPVSSVHRDHPIRWVRRKTDPPPASADAELPRGAS